MLDSTPHTQALTDTGSETAVPVELSTIIDVVRILLA